MALKIDAADRIFSRYIRTRDGWKCKRCLRQFQPGSPGLHNSHYFGRARENTRFDPENCDALCYGCHQYWGSTDRESYRQFKIDQLGQDAFELLTIRAATYAKKDRAMAKIQAELMLKNLGV